MTDQKPISIAIPIPTGKTKKEVIDHVASRLREELKNHPDKISMSRRSVHFEGRRRGEAVYTVSYHFDQAGGHWRAIPRMTVSQSP